MYRRISQNSGKKCQGWELTPDICKPQNKFSVQILYLMILKPFRTAMTRVRIGTSNDLNNIIINTGRHHRLH